MQSSPSPSFPPLSKTKKKREKTAVDDVETATLDLVLLTKLELLKKSEAARLALVDASEGFEEDDLPPGSTMLLVGGGRALGGAAARELAADANAVVGRLRGAATGQKDAYMMF